MSSSRLCRVALSATLACASLAALAPMSDGVARAELDGSLDLGLAYRYSGARALGHGGLLESRLLIFPGARHAPCVGLEGELGATDGHLEYRGDALPVGYRHRGPFTTLSICAGGGVRGLQGVLDPAYRAIGAAEAAFDVDIFRAALRIASGFNVAGGDRPDTDLDELSAALRFSFRELVQVPGVTASSGYFLGLSYERYLRGNTWGVILGYGYAARNF